MLGTLLAPWTRCLVLGIALLISPLLLRFRCRKQPQPRSITGFSVRTVRAISILLFLAGIVLGGSAARNPILLQEGAFMFLLGGIGFPLADLFVRLALGGELPKDPKAWRAIWLGTTMTGLFMLAAS